MAATGKNMDLHEVVIRWQQNPDAAGDALLQTVSTEGHGSQRPVESHADPIQQFLDEELVEQQQFQLQYGELFQPAELPSLDPIPAAASSGIDQTQVAWQPEPNLLYCSSLSDVDYGIAPAEPASNFSFNYNGTFNDVPTMADSTSAELASSNFNLNYNLNFNQVHNMAAPGGSIFNDTPILDHNQFILPNDLEYFTLPETTLPINQRLARPSMHPHGFVEIEEQEADEPEILYLPDRVSAMASGASATSNENQSSTQIVSSEPDWTIIPAAVVKPIPCVKCWYDKKKCEGGSPCKRCIKAQTNLPQSICMRVRFANQSVFTKWNVPSYEKKLVWESLFWVSNTKTASLGHDIDGPTLSIRCHEFLAYEESQVRLFWKSDTGWNWVPTTAYTIESLDITKELDLYIRQYAAYYLQKATEGDNALSHIFKMAIYFTDKPIIQLSLKLWSANRLLMQGWSIVGGDEMLGMSVINEPASLLHNTIPAPKVIQNQLDHLLERQIFETEENLLKLLQNLIRRRDRGQWIVVFLSLVIILHVLERDTWRLVYWVHHKQEANTWRHPLKPINLIDKSIYLSNLLLAHFYYAAAGSLPLSLDWGAPATRKLVDDNAAVVHSMQALQIHTQNLRRDERLGRKGRERYKERSDESLDFTLSSLVLSDDFGTFADLEDFVPVQ